MGHTRFPTHRTRRLRAALLLAALTMAGALTLSQETLGADSIDELNQRIEAARSDARSLAAEIDAATAQLAAAQERAIAAAEREAELSAVLARSEAREARLEAEVQATALRLERTRDELGGARNVLAERLVAIYRGGMPDMTTLLLESDGFDDLATRAEYLRRVEEADAALVSRVRVLRDSVADALAAVEQAEARAEAHTARVAAAREEIAAVRAEAEADAAALSDLRASRQAAIEELQAQVGRWTEEVQRLRRISAAAAREEVSQWFGDWAIPESIVMCESGGNWEAVNPTSGAGGAYQILPSTWELYGGEGLPQDASPAEQSEIAAQIWADSGSAAWVCAG